VQVGPTRVPHSSSVALRCARDMSAALSPPLPVRRTSMCAAWPTALSLSLSLSLSLPLSLSHSLSLCLALHVCVVRVPGPLPVRAGTAHGRVRGPVLCPLRAGTAHGRVPQSPSVALRCAHDTNTVRSTSSSPVRRTSMCAAWPSFRPFRRTSMCACRVHCFGNCARPSHSDVQGMAITPCSV